MISQSMNAVPPGLQALMVLRQESSPTAPGPNGPIPSMAAQELQKVAQAQNPGLSGIAQNTATGNAIEMQQQQAAQKALMDQMLAQQQAKTQQPVLAAEGGIASLYAGNMDDFAEGGVVGYNGTQTSEVNLGGVSDIPYYAPGPSEERERLNRLPIDALEKLLELLGQGGRRLVKGTTFDPEYNKPKNAPEEPVPATLGAQAPTGGGLTTEAARGQAPREERRVPPAPEQKPAATGIASGRGSNIPSIQQLINEATMPLTAALAGYTAPEQKTEQQLEEARRMVLARRGLPEQAMAVEEQGLAELRRQNDAIRAFKEAELARQEAALGSPGEQSMNRFMSAIRYGAQGGKGSFAQGLENARLAEEAGIAGRRKAQLEMLETGKAEAIEYTRIQALVTAARRAEAAGDMATAQKLADEAREAANKIVLARAEGAKTAIAPAISAFSGMRQQQMQAASAERIAALKGESASAKPIYDIINDNVQKEMTAWAQLGRNKWATPAEVAAQRAKFVAEQITLAKQMGHTITPEMEALIKGTSAAPGTRENPIKLD